MKNTSEKDRLKKLENKVTSLEKRIVLLEKLMKNNHEESNKDGNAFDGIELELKEEVETEYYVISFDHTAVIKRFDAWRPNGNGGTWHVSYKEAKQGYHFLVLYGTIENTGDFEYSIVENVISVVDINSRKYYGDQVPLAFDSYEESINTFVKPGQSMGFILYFEIPDGVLKNNSLAKFYCGESIENSECMEELEDAEEVYIIKGMISSEWYDMADLNKKGQRIKRPLFDDFY